MSRFDELMDEVMMRAKSAADAASKKTSEMVEIGKLSYQIKQVQWDIEKTNAKLGAIVYESRKSTENFDEVIDLAVGEIDMLAARLLDLEERLRACKKVIKCPECGKENDLSNMFCSRCGHSIEQEKSADESEPAPEPTPEPEPEHPQQEQQEQ